MEKKWLLNGDLGDPDLNRTDILRTESLLFKVFAVCTPARLNNPQSVQNSEKGRGREAKEAGTSREPSAVRWGSYLSRSPWLCATDALLPYRDFRPWKRSGNSLHFLLLQRHRQKVVSLFLCINFPLKEWFLLLQKTQTQHTLMPTHPNACIENLLVSKRKGNQLLSFIDRKSVV